MTHFRGIWEDKIHISNRSFRRWRGKFYGGVLDTASTAATSITGASRVRARRPSIFEEELDLAPASAEHVHTDVSHEEEPDLQAPASAEHVHKDVSHEEEPDLQAPASAEHVHKDVSPQRTQRVPRAWKRRPRTRPPRDTMFSRTQRYIPPPTHASVEASKTTSTNAYWYIYKQHREWARDCAVHGRPPPRMHPALAGIIYEKFKIIC